MVRPIRLFAARALVCLAAGIAFGPLAAAEKVPVRKDAATKPSSDAVLTPAQLRACMTQQDQLKAQADDALKDRAAVEQDRAEIAKSDAALGAEVASVDRASSDAVDGYNAKVQAQDQRARALESRVAAYNAKAEAVQAAKASFQQACGNRRYDDRDLEDLKRRKK